MIHFFFQEEWSEKAVLVDDKFYATCKTISQNNDAD